MNNRNYDSLKKSTPKNAIILAAGMGLGMVPINAETPKGLVEVFGERIVERLIGQLHSVGVYDITVVVGYMKEQYEYLTDKCGVQIAEAYEYANKNSLYSLKTVADKICNTYIVPCDVWCRVNPFSTEDEASWYMVVCDIDKNSWLSIGENNELICVENGGNAMIGISYISAETAELVRENMYARCCEPNSDTAIWEESLITCGKLIVSAKTVKSDDVVEINTYEQLRKIDAKSPQLETPAIIAVTKALNAELNEITNVTVLKKGMTNRSFRFTCRGKEYIMRIPGEGTAHLINRRQEAAVYKVIEGLSLCDDVAYINPDNGYKITDYFESARVCDPKNMDDVAKCMKYLRRFHEMNLKTEHAFDIFGQIDYYESLWEGEPSAYDDYCETKRKVLSLKEYIDSVASSYCLTHIDAVPDNFLFIEEADGTEGIRLIDWEYAGMQDPHVDLAMFCIYSMYDRSQVDQLIDLYFVEGCSHETRLKIYCYIAVCGLLWSNWCEYKSLLGVEFGEYSLRQYSYAKEYYQIVMEERKPKNFVKRAIIMAAGEGVRMHPVTITTPKPLVKVNGTRMIDTVIRGLRNNGITEIYVVVGYLKEQFAGLPGEYPGLVLIENELFHSCNNISSLYAAREHLQDVIIIDGDQIIYNDEILSPEFERSGYNAVYTEHHTNEWLMTVTDGIVTGCSRTGGDKGWQLYSISRWSKEDGEKLKHQLEFEFEVNKSVHLYWDDLPMFCYPDEYTLGVREMHKEDVIEIDNFDELTAVDNSYLK